MSEPNPDLTELITFARGQLGYPDPKVERVIDLVVRKFVQADEMAADIAELRDRVAKLEAAAPAPDASADLHRRLAALEAARPVRAAAPAAKPAAASA